MPCTYTDKPAVDASVGAESYEMLDVLRSASESEAFGILRLLRTNSDLSVVMPAVRALLESKESPAELASEASSRSQEAPYPSLEFELMTKNPVSYPALLPLFAASLEERNMLRPVKLRRAVSYDSRFAP